MGKGTREGEGREGGRGEGCRDAEREEKRKRGRVERASVRGREWVLKGVSRGVGCRLVSTYSRLVRYSFPSS